MKYAHTGRACIITQTVCKVLAYRCSSVQLCSPHKICVFYHLVLHNPYKYISFTAEECSALPPLLNGAITYAPDMIADYDVGTVATYSCDPGFRLSGFETRQCLRGAIWSNLVPMCIGT